MKTIIFTGGGSGGHVIPALTLIQEIKKNYSETKIEKDVNNYLDEDSTCIVVYLCAIYYIPIYYSIIIKWKLYTHQYNN